MIHSDTPQIGQTATEYLTKLGSALFRRNAQPLPIEFPPLLPQLIGITGKSGVGKDMLADYLVNQHRYNKYSFAAPIKRMVNALLQEDGDAWESREWKEAILKDIGYSPRQLAQTLGTEWGRARDKDFWIIFAERVVSEQRLFVIPDVRFDNEADWIRDRGGLVIRLTRKGAKKVSRHSSELGIAKDLVDVSFSNDSSKEELFSKVMEWLYANYA
jgi:hypothetical protein